MPPYFIPKRSGPHRIACKALYRALLSECSRLEVPRERFRGPINPIKYFIRKQFRRNQHETSATYVVTALKIGYEAEELLRTAADGDKIAYSKVLSLLSELQSQGDADRIRVALRPQLQKPERVKPKPYPGAPKVLEVRPRPLSELSGRRRVPILVAANGIPFLRIRKPQSPFLSRVLRDKIVQRQKLQDYVSKLESDIVWAAKEDEWEALVGMREGLGGSAKFETEMRVAKGEPQRKLRQLQAKSSELGSRMLEIVDEERRLLVEERAQRREERRRKRREEKESQEGSPVSNELSVSGEQHVDLKSVKAGS